MAKMAQGPSPAALEVRRLAESERVRLGHPYLGDEHLLLGVLAHASNRAAAMLTERGLDLTTARAGIARLTEEAGPIARDDAAVLREFGIDVAQMRRQLESTFGVLAVHEAERHVRLRPRWRGRGGHSPLCGPPYLTSGRSSSPAPPPVNAETSRSGPSTCSTACCAWPVTHSGPG